MRLRMLAVVATSVAAMVAGPASAVLAAPTGQYGCPASSVGFTESVAYQEALANGIDTTVWTAAAYHAFWVTVDHNGDGVLCAHPISSGTATGHDAGERNWTDNNSNSPNGS